jgi:hypothetical protein
MCIRDRLQDLSGVPLSTFRQRGTSISEAQVAYGKAPGFEGRVAPRLRLMRGASVRDQLLPALTEGRVAIVAVNYGEVQDAGKGVGTFRKGHAVVVGEPEATHITVADPLRRDLVRWRIDLLVRAMESFGRKPWLNGRGEAGIFQPSPTFLEQAIAQRDRARADLRAAKERIAALEQGSQPDCTAAVAQAAAEATRIEHDRLVAIVEQETADLVARIR